MPFRTVLAILLTCVTVLYVVYFGTFLTSGACGVVVRQPATATVRLAAAANDDPDVPTYNVTGAVYRRDRGGGGSSERPFHILQFGPRRTATTLQHRILCVCMFVKLYDEGTKDGNGNLSAVEKLSCPFKGEFSPDAPMVIKRHSLKPYPPDVERNERMWLFSTAPPGGDALETFRSLKARGYDVKYVQDGRTLDRMGHSVVYEYQSFFGLTDDQMEGILEFARYWMVLRRCCGTQMSKDWRQRLLPPDERDGNYTAHRGAHAPSYPACEMYDIRMVERLLLDTGVATSMSKFPLLRPAISPALKDPELDGDYCSRYNEAVTAHGLSSRNDEIPKA